VKKNAKLAVSILVVAVFLIAIVFCFVFFPKNDFAFGVMLGGEKIGGLSKEKTTEILENKINEFLEKKIAFSFTPSKEKISETSNQNETYLKEIKIKDLGLTFKINESLEEPFSIGKKNNFWQNLKEKFLALQGKYQFPLIVEINDQVFDNFFIENFGQFEILPQNAQIIFNEKLMDFEIQDSKEGLLFPKDKIQQEIQKDAAFLKNNDFYLSLEKTMPEIGKEEALEAIVKAEEIINAGPYILLDGEKKIELSKKNLGTWFSFLPKKDGSRTVLSPAFDEGLIKNYLSDLSKSLNVNPQNPILSFENNNLKIISLPKAGKILNIEKSAKEIQEKILTNSNEKKIALIFETVEPKITEEKFNDLRIETLIGKGVSNFAGSPKNRIHNIKIAAEKFNGTLIAPDEEFSFNRALGEVGPSQGYLPELVIKNNKTVPEYGGGVCQVSTTMFRAAVYSGMDITERHPHAYPVKYYNPQGFDATVYSPSPDLKFKNNTGNWVLIQTKIEGNNLIFEFYGKDDGREVIVKGPYQYDFKEDGSMKARLEEEVWKDGNLFLKKIFLSSYASPKLYPTESAE